MFLFLLYLLVLYLESVRLESLKLRLDILMGNLRPAGDLITLSDYTYQKGIQGELLVSASDTANDKDVSASAYEGMSYQEDIAALCVQCLQSLDWTKSRSMTVSTAGPLVSENIQNPKRPDQQWCVNSLVLESALGGMN